MAIELVTGTPGAGKTTYAVAERIDPESRRSVSLEDDTCLKLGLDPGSKVQRRIVVAGVRGLVCQHERLPHILTKDATPLADVDRWNAMVQEPDPVTGKSRDSDRPVHQRLPGEPAREDVPAIMQNWWLWCRPGDFIVIDEAQFVMPRGTLGRKPPYWLQAMEIHRHYGVDFLIITQHPQLIDTTVRALVGLHRHVRSVMGSSLCAVYTWDHASNPERYNLANKSLWRRRAAHYKLFHSSVAHVKPPTSGRSVLIVVPVLLLGVGLLTWKFTQRFRSNQQAIASPAASAASSVPLRQMAAGPVALPKGTSLAVGPVVKDREPYAGFGVHWAGGWLEGRALRGYFTLSLDGRSVGNISLARIVEAGYIYSQLAPCVGLLSWQGKERVVRCDPPVAQSTVSPSALSSAPAASGVSAAAPVLPPM